MKNIANEFAFFNCKENNYNAPTKLLGNWWSQKDKEYKDNSYKILIKGIGYICVPKTYARQGKDKQDQIMLVKGHVYWIYFFKSFRKRFYKYTGTTNKRNSSLQLIKGEYIIRLIILFKKLRNESRYMNSKTISHLFLVLSEKIDNLCCFILKIKCLYKFKYIVQPLW